MSDLSKIDVLKARRTPEDATSMRGFERADLSGRQQGQGLHVQIGRRLRNVFPAPEEQEDAFESLLKQISGRAP